MTIKFTNNATTTLASGINSSVTSLSVASGTGTLFPTISSPDVFYATLANVAGTVEIVKVTARSTDVFTIVRGQDGTTPLSWAAGDKVELRPTAAGLAAMAQFDSNQTYTGLQTFAGTTTNADIKTSNILETATVSATAATGTINYDVTTQSVLYYTTNASGNFTVNFRASGSSTLNSIMSTGESLSTTFLCTNGSTAYYNSAVTVDGNSVTPKWQGGTAPTSGNASSVDGYTYVIIKTGSAAFTVLASQTKFA
jgi:hypothetical protein